MVSVGERELRKHRLLTLQMPHEILHVTLSNDDILRSVFLQQVRADLHDTDLVVVKLGELLLRSQIEAQSSLCFG